MSESPSPVTAAAEREPLLRVNASRRDESEISEHSLVAVENRNDQQREEERQEQQQEVGEDDYFPKTGDDSDNSDGEDNTENRNSQKKAKQQQKQRVSFPVLVLLVVLFIVFTVASTIGRKLSVDSFGQDLAFFRQQLGILLYVLWCVGIVVVLICKDKIPREHLVTGLYFLCFALAGFFDGTADFLSSVGGVHSSGSLQSLLSQMTVPITLLIAYFGLKQRFTLIQFVGAAVILAGACIACIPLFLDKKQKKAEGETTYWWAVLLFFISQIPTSLSYVWKQHLFDKYKFNVVYLSGSVSLIQLFLSWLWVPILSIPALGGISLDKISLVMKKGAQCFAGQSDVLQSATTDNLMQLALENKTAHFCRGAYVPIVTLSYSLCGFIQGILLLAIVAVHSASLAVLCTAVSLPVSNLAYALPSIGDESVTWEDILGLLLCLVGLLLYQSKNIMKEWHKYQKKKNNQEKMQEEAGEAEKVTEKEEREEKRKEEE